MEKVLLNLLTASFHGSVVILAVLILRLLLRKTPRKYICLLWLLAGLRLLLPVTLRSELSLQPEFFLQNPLADIAAMGFAPWAWGAVAFCFALYSILSYVRLRNRVREAVQIPGGWESDRIDTAFILGFIKPRIYIPMGMDRENRQHILAHERTHLDKGDHWIKMIGFLALALHWFNPLVWLAYGLLCKDIETACDERVVQFMELEERKAYSAALLRCSSRERYFSPNPVAFGEISVKARIASVLKYRKPGFWISLLGVAAFFFVALCLVTSPSETPEPVILEVPMATEAAEEAPTETRAPSSFAEGLTQEDVIRVCTEAIDRLCQAESYCIKGETKTVYPNEEYTIYQEVFRYGNDALNLCRDPSVDGKTDAMGSRVYFGDSYGMYYGDYWVWEGKRNGFESDPNRWLKNYSPENLTVSFPQGTGVIGQDRVSFQAEWDQSYRGTVTFVFDGEGNAVQILREYAPVYDAQDPKQEAYCTTNILTVVSESPAAIYDTVAEYAGQCISLERLEVLRREQNRITEIPSNKTQYDRDYLLGSGQMRWYFFDEEWQFALGAEETTATGLRLFYCESGEGHCALTAEEGFWLERFAEGKWSVLEPENPVTNAPAREIRVSWTGRDTADVDWTDSYGVLEPGFYRLGRYHTVRMNDGRTETIHCYAKFRIYDPERDELLREARAAMDTLLTAEHYHLYNFNWQRNLDTDCYRSSEVWKSGKDYLQVTGYPSRKDRTEITKVTGSMWRDGKHYSLSWAGEPARSALTDWTGCVEGYMDDSNFSTWSMDYQWYDAAVEEICRRDNTIEILQSGEGVEDHPFSRIILTFDGSGGLKAVTKVLLPTRDSASEDGLTECELVVFDSGREETAARINAQDIDTPIPFSYAEDMANGPDGQTVGFRNTAPTAVKTASDALRLADRESTMEPLMEFETGYCQYRVSRDEGAGIWKVEMFWWQHDTRQTVYMDDRGITQRIVSEE